MVKYSLDHLTQPDSQKVSGPIQDDEALFLFALIRGCRLRRVLEIGGLGGYSARNFCAAVGPDGIVFTVDVNKVPKVAENHFPIQKDARYLTAEDVRDAPLDLVFFDCHRFDVQMEMYRGLRQQALITDDTVLALHDTNLHPFKAAPWAYPIEGGYVHQRVEREMVNEFRRHGYEGFALHTDLRVHGPDLPYRHGVTILRPFRQLAV